MYPRKEMTGSHTVKVEYDPPKFESIELSNGLIELVDSDHARDNATRRSCHCVLGLLNEIIIHWKMQQQKIVALNSTDSEIRGALAATKEGIYLQDICSFLKLDNEIIRQDTLIKTFLGVPQLINTNKIAKADRDDQRKD